MSLKDERDPHSGYLTTGHEWNGIKELNRPVPKAIWLFLSLAFIFALSWWILMPAWPTGRSYTHGILGVDQRTAVAQNLAAAATQRAAWTDQIGKLSFDQIKADPQLMRYAAETGHTLFGDNCAACHGRTGQGGKGFPNLTDTAWLWGGALKDVAETIRVGINSSHDQSRSSQMPAFGHDQILDHSQINDVVAYVQSLSATGTSAISNPANVTAGAQIFADNCAACHGETGQGSTDMGAPNLTDNSWLYGGDADTLYTTIYYGRQGQMPSWEGRLSPLERKILTLYVAQLGTAKK